MLWKARCVCCILPPHILDKLIDNADKDVRDSARETQLLTATLRGERRVRSAIAFVGSAPTGGRRTIFDCKHGSYLPGAKIVRAQDAPPVRDTSVNNAYDGLKSTYDFYYEILARDSIDDAGMRMDGYVHYGRKFNNAFWDGQEMVFGDGDGKLFVDFTGSLDVIAHELTHGVTDHSAGLAYHDQSGALNESISDVFGSLVKQWSRKETADQADWLIGAEIFTPRVKGDALRSMKAPGTAYDDPDLGKDPQPDHMDHYQNLPNTQAGDWGGVHINSGIPNKAFYLAASKIGGFAWEKAGKVWYAALKASSPNTDFKAFATTTYLQATTLFPADAKVRDAVQAAWEGVGVPVEATIVRSALAHA